MKYFVPKLEEAGEFNSQVESKEKLGGLPFGLPTENYPVCKECGNPMSLLVQLFHHYERLNLGKNGRVLFIFQCNNLKKFSLCSTWDDDSGANACFIVEPEDLTSQTEKLPEGDFRSEKEFWIADWETCDDGLLEEVSEIFLDEQKYHEVEDDGLEEFYKNLKEETKFGSVPFWIQSPEIPKGEWHFVGQLDDLTGFSFGDAGIGYIFIEKTEGSAHLPDGKFFWQCS